MKEKQRKMVRDRICFFFLFKYILPKFCPYFNVSILQGRGMNIADK